jgi:hypothetical protein
LVESYGEQQQEQEQQQFQQQQEQPTQPKNTTSKRIQNGCQRLFTNCIEF